MRSPEVKTRAYRLILVALLMLCTLGKERTVWAQASTPEESEESNGYVREVRDIEVGKEGIPNPTGITYLPEAKLFLVLEQSSLAEVDNNVVELFFVTSGEEVVGSVTLETSISKLNNVTYDPVAKRVLILDDARNELVEVKLGADNLPDPSTMTRVNVQQFGIESPQGMTIAADGALLLLDAVGPRIVQVAPGSTGSFEGAAALNDGRISEITLQIPGLIDAQGLAIDPATGHLFIVSPSNNEILELTASAEVVSVRDTEEFFIRTPQAMVFAPSGDNTDDPEQMSLYIVHRAGAPVSAPAIGPQVNPPANRFFLPLLRGGNQATIARTEGGLIKELSFLAPPAIAQAADATTATLVQTIYTADFPTPSGDTAGVAYIESSDHFLFNDSEIEEMPAHYKGANIFRITRANPPSLVYTYTTAFKGTPPGFTDEPTGIAYNQENGNLYVISDDDDGIYTINPGPDGDYGTLDDIRTFLNTTQYGAADPEDIAYSNTPPTFYVADGENAEVYVISSGNNGIFDGRPPGGDDVVTHFDTFQHTITDMEGIGYDSINGTLYLAGGNKTTVAEVTTSGDLIRLIDISVIRSGAGARTPAGIIKAPSSFDPAIMSLYITDRGIDNDTNPTKPFDGAIYEVSAGSLTPGNTAPVVTAAADATVGLGASAQLTGTVTDDGIPASPGVTSLWTKVSGPGNVVFANNAAPSTTATFSAAGTYVLRLAANDGELGATAEVSISVTAIDGTIVVEKRVSVGSDDAEEVVANGAIGTVLTTHTDLALGNDGPTGNLRRMLVGIRFPGLAIPRGATITKAYVQFTVDENDSSLSHSVLIKGQGTDNPATFTATPNNISDIDIRPRTVASVTWSIPVWPTIGAATEAQRTADLTPIVQELVDRSGWTNGNAMAFLINWISGARRIAESYEGLPTGAPLLHIEYQPNEAPVVNAGPDQAALFPTATITGTLTDDGVPAAATTLWTKVSGPGSVTFTNDSALNTTATFSISGIYVLRLTATDGEFTASDDITISVATDNQAPIVDAGPNQAVTFPNSATLDGTVTDDGLPTAATTNWTQVSGPGTVTFAIDTAIDTTATFSEEGAYVLRLTATDGEFTVSDDITITVATGNQAPIVDAGSNQTITLPSSATLDGTLTDDVIPSAATTTWSKVSGPGDVTFAEDNAVDTTASFSAPGDYVLSLTATDGEFTISDDVTITVVANTEPTNAAPEVNAGPDQTITLSNSATLDGIVTDDGLPAVATTLWTKVSGPGDVTFADANELETTATFSEAGTYVLRLTADDGELSISDDISITVVTEQSDTPSLLLPSISK